MLGWIFFDPVAEDGNFEVDGEIGAAKVTFAWDTNSRDTNI